MRAVEAGRAGTKIQLHDKKARRDLNVGNAERAALLGAGADDGGLKELELKIVIPICGAAGMVESALIAKLSRLGVHRGDKQRHQRQQERIYSTCRSDQIHRTFLLVLLCSGALKFKR